ncbi:MAG: amidohydrolase [Clostridia bacterium]|jgi:predicted TIM-barrel fold metal-dependent hydrolase|nr:amidohydrolase [Clostridia bacterium]
MIIDFHTHLLPPETGEDPYSFALSEPYFGYRMIDTPARKSFQTWVTYREAVLHMNRDGIDLAVIQGWPFMHYESCCRQNNYTLEAVKAYPGRFRGFCIVNPKDGVNALREVERCAQKGLTGIGELDPEGQGFQLNDPDFLRLCDLCVDLDLPMSIHASEPVGPHYHGKSSVPLQEYIDLAKAKPLLKIILSHWGGGLPFYELMRDIKKALVNVYYDTASSPLHCSPKIFKETLTIVGPDKLLFGSNYPRLLKPAEEKEPGFSTLINTIKEEISEESNLDKLLYRNAAGLLGLIPEGGNDSCEA